MQQDHLFDEDESCGVEAEYEGERRSITGVIHIAESRGEDIRAQLMRNLKSLVQESRRLRDLTRELALAEGLDVTPK